MLKNRINNLLCVSLLNNKLRNVSFITMVLIMELFVQGSETMKSIDKGKHLFLKERILHGYSILLLILSDFVVPVCSVVPRRFVKLPPLKFHLTS